MALEPVKIPQNVYIEDRVVGPLTLKQTIIMTLGGGFSYALYSSMQKSMGHVGIPLTVLAWLPCAVCVLFSIVKINDLTLMRICFLLLEKMNKSPVRTWAPRRGISINFHVSASKPDEDLAKAQKETAKVQQTQSTIKELSSVVDSQFAVADVAAPAVDAVTAPPAAEAAQAEARPSQPVNPSAIKVDGPAGLSDLSVFRDVFSSPSHS